MDSNGFDRHTTEKFVRECFEIQTLKGFLAQRVHQWRRKPA
jgi:hypothetical protein